MLQVQEYEEQLNLKFTGESATTEEATRRVTAFLDHSSHTVRTPALLVFRELVNNAIRHGHKNNPSKGLCSTIKQLNEEAILIEVQDQGQGFPFQDLDFSLPTDARTLEHRGYKLIHALSEDIAFNEKGNKASVYLKLRGKAPP